MAVTHLTDEQIQRYLDGDASLEAEDVKRHLQQCKVCQPLVQAYAQVYEGLRQDAGFELPPGFVESVISRLVSPAKASARNNLTGLILIIMGIITTLCAGIYFVRDTSFAEVLSGIPSGITAFDISLVESLQAATSNLGVSVDLLLFTGFILLTFAVLERILIWSRGRHYCL